MKRFERSNGLDTLKQLNISLVIYDFRLWAKYYRQYQMHFFRVDRFQRKANDAVAIVH